MYKFRFFSYMACHKAKVAGMIILAIFMSVLSAFTPFLNSQLIDYGLANKNIGMVIKSVFLLCTISFLCAVFNYIQIKLEADIRCSIECKLKAETFEHAIKIKPKYLRDNALLQVLSDAWFDVEQVLCLAEQSFLTIFLQIFKTIGACVALFFLNWKLSLFVLILVPVKIAISNFVTKKTFRLSKEYKDKNIEYNSWFEDVTNGVFDVKIWDLYSRFSNENDEFNRYFSQNVRKRNLLRGAQMQSVIAIEEFILYLVYILGGFFIIGEGITLGTLISFIAFSSYLLHPIDIILTLKRTVVEIKPSLDGLSNFFSIEEEQYSGFEIGQNYDIRSICFDKVSYTDGLTKILDEVSFSISKGEKVAFVGDNGSGKTSIINLLMGLSEVTDGQILINQESIKTFDVNSYRRQISTVMQHIHLFHTDIKNNILLGNLDENKIEISQREHFLTSFIDRFPNGLNTEIGVGGTKLSGGERQKIGILRALQRKAKILILDEATSGFDNESEKFFDEFIASDQIYDFYIIITHRRNILRFVDKVIHLENGKITFIEEKGEEQ